MPIVDFGSNPVNVDNAYRQAVESGLDSEHPIIELAANGEDYGTDVHIILNGDFVAPHNMKLNSVIVQDNGCGMHHDTVLERFRGAYQDSDSHVSNIQCGRNGVGVKTCFQFWKNVFVETTSKDQIPTEWMCEPEHLDLIDTTYKALSKLKPGDDDTELRKYNVTLKQTTCDEAWEKVPHVQSGTKITLKNPRTTIKVDVEEIIRRLSHDIDFLSKDNHRITLHYKNQSNNMTEVVVKPFFEREKPSFICHAKGDSTKDIFITVSGNQSILFPKSTDPELGKVDFDIKITSDVKSGEDDVKTPNELIISICGSNVYDSPKKGSGPSNACIQILNLDKFENTTGFAYRVHGFIKSNDIELKKALRFNKSALALQDKYAKKFFEYIVKLFKILNEQYIQYLDQFNIDQESKLLKDVELEFNKILSGHGTGPGKGPNGTDNGTSHENIHAEYECAECGLVWKVPKLKQPTYCAEYNIKPEEEGCDSSEIRRRTIKLAGISFKWTPFLGNFIPARYEENEKVVYLAQYHPSFITTLSGKNKYNFQKTGIINMGLIALTINQAGVPGFEKTYGNNLKLHFYNKVNQVHINECLRIWKANKITQEEI